MAMQSKGFTLIELVILALLIGIITCIALPTFTAPLPKRRASKHRAYVASMQADLTRLVGAEEDYFRDSRKYTSTVVCATPPAPGVLNFCPSRGNVLGTSRLGFGARGPGWGASIRNRNLPNVVGSVFINEGAFVSGAGRGAAAVSRPGLERARERYDGSDAVKRGRRKPNARSGSGGAGQRGAAPPRATRAACSKRGFSRSSLRAHSTASCSISDASALAPLGPVAASRFWSVTKPR
jgi:type II secretory pathway pseudopilin PulG